MTNFKEMSMEIMMICFLYLAIYLLFSVDTPLFLTSFVIVLKQIYKFLDTSAVKRWRLIAHSLNLGQPSH